MLRREGNPPPVLKAMLAVLPKGVQFFPVGGVAPGNMEEVTTQAILCAACEF